MTWAAETNIKGPKGDKGDKGDPGTPGASDWVDITNKPSTFPPDPEAVDDRVAGLLAAGANITLTYDDPGNRLTIASTASGGGGKVTTASSPPPSPANGDLWFEDDTGILYMFYVDVNSSQWVALTSSVGAGMVRYDAAQTLTAAQQVQARQNVYAAPFDAMAYNGMQINGSFDVSQERGYNNPISVANANPYVCDGWLYSCGGAAVVTGQIGSVSGIVTPPGIAHWFGGLVTTAAPSLASNAVATLFQKIEGYRVARLNWGFSNAQPITIAFWSGHPRAGTYSIFVRNATTYDRCYVTTYTQNVGGTWEYKTVTIPGDTTGTWGRDNVAGMEIGFTQAAGTSLVAPAANVWGSGVYLAAPGQVNGVAALSDSFNLSNIVILPGIEAPSAARSALIMRPYDQELLTCQRYFRQWGGSTLYEPIAVGQGLSATTALYPIPLIPTMRVAPTLGFVGTIGTMSPNSASIPLSNISIQLATPLVAFILGTVASGLTAGNATVLETYNDLTARIKLDARL